MKHPAPLAAMACLLLSSAILAGGGVITFSGRIVEAQCPMSLSAPPRDNAPSQLQVGKCKAPLHLEALLANGKTLPLQAKADARSSSQPSANGLDLDRSERSRSFSIATPKNSQRGQLVVSYY
ncbi:MULTISPECIES: hypothetical protein [Chromobacterium]|uniref:Type 1 fimbrial protein n=1 Tax=Chromobacterium aquaticum TaxID=467180 RepID=A0ABV8ZXB8_9NEIS|nr:MULTISPECIES: hypothetical protein [Chromobacterium]MCD5362239.1 hypothetical protein [Chromobacterium aquaticum]